jgi:hypothetical protein
MNWSINRAPGTQHDFLCGIGRFIKSQGHQSFIGEKGRIISRVVCVERTPGNLTRTDITGLPGALNEVSGILVIPAKHIPQDTHHVTTQPNSLNEFGDNILYVMYQHQISLKETVISHITLKVRATQLVKPKWDKNQTINRAANKENKVCVKIIREHIHYYFLEQQKS